MPARSTIMDTNSFREGDRAVLSPETLAMTDRRTRLLGPSYRLFYRNPVHLVRGQGAYLWDADGTKYLDVYNNVASIGHAHPAVVAATAAQMQQLNTHTRYLHENVLNYAEDLLSTLPPEIDQAMFTCTGSEANDLAVRIAKFATNAEGIIISREAYHGNTALISTMSPALTGADAVGEAVRLVDPPDRYRVDDPDLGAWFAREVQAQIDDLAASGIAFAGLVFDSIFSSDGVMAGPAGMLQEAVDVVHANGGLVIADEVQPGFARTGEAFWGFARHGIVPDLVTVGKPMANGIPVAGLMARAEVLAPFATSVPYFNTFGGNPVSMAAAQAVLDTIRREQLQEHSRRVGALLLGELKPLMDRHEVVGDLRGSGLFIGFELVTDRETKAPASELALDVIEHLREHGVLTSVAGPHGNVLKLRPPLAFGEHDIDWLVGALDHALSDLAPAG